MAKKKRPAKVSDYSLTGKDSLLAVMKSLVEAAWYTYPVPKAKIRELLERRDQPAIRDTLLWVGLLFLFGLRSSSQDMGVILLYSYGSMPLEFCRVLLVRWRAIFFANAVHTHSSVRVSVATSGLTGLGL